MSGARRFWLLGAGGLFLVLSLACLPIPVRRDVLLRPQGTITVVDAGGHPVSEATVTVRRYNLGPPPERVTHRWIGQTDAKGQVFFTLDTGRETVMPLMMHGVPQWGWQACAEAGGYAGTWERWVVQYPGNDPAVDGTSVPSLRLQLSPGDGEPCDWPPLQPSPDGVIEERLD